MKSWKGVIGLVCLLVSVADGEDRMDKKVVELDSTGDSYQPRTPEQARSELSERGIQYTRSSFFESVEKGDLFAVQLFVDAGMAIHARTNQGKTSLMVAAEEGDVEMVRFLANKGADVNTPDNRGRTPLRLAEEKGLQEVADFLKEIGITEAE